MLDARSIPVPASELSVQDRFSTVTATAYQLLAVVIFAIIPIIAIGWMRQPFLGAFIEHTMIANAVAPRQAGTWHAFGNGLETFGFQLQTINGIEIHSPAQLERELQNFAVGEEVALHFIHVDTGEEKEFSTTLQAFPIADQVSYFYLPYMLGIVYLLTGLWVFNLRRNEPAGRAFVMFSASVALALGGLFDVYTTSRFVYLWTAALPLAGGGLLIMALVYPQEIRIVQRFPLTRWLPLLPIVPLYLSAAWSLFNAENPAAYVVTWRNLYLFAVAGVIAFVLGAAYRGFTAASPIVREQARMILIGMVVSFTPLSIWFVSTAVNPGVIFSPLLLLPLVFFPIATGYSILRYRFLNTDYILSRGFLYALLTILTGTVYILVVWGVNLAFGSVVSANNPLVIGVMIFVVAAALNPTRERLQRAIDSIFFKGRVVYQERLQQFGNDLTQAVELPQIIQLLRQYIDFSLQPEEVHIFLHDPLSDQYIAAVDPQGYTTSDIRFSIHSALVQFMAREKTSIFLGEQVEMPRGLASDRARLALLGAQLYIPLLGQKQLTGWLALSRRKSGEYYSTRDLTFIEALSAQAALAVERAQVVFDLQRRVHEMNVLGRVAQGVNVTINFDDILELIYAQTVQVLNAQHFRITLYDDLAQHFRHAFYLENDDRLLEKENVVLPAGLGLEQEVVRTQRPILTEDYDRECRRRSIIPAEQGLYAWIGVPLNTGTRTIGSISLGSREPAVVYTAEQQAILQSIADQAAGAIVKTQLLEESERRARQLEMLNQVARSLTSELELDPLLNRILESAVDILRCEAGSLFLIDDETGELVFEVVVGGAEDLVGVRLAPGTGLVGKSVISRQPIIDNNVQQSKDWFEKTDQETGFITRALLVVPMQVRDEVVGVIEVMNKVDRSPFTPDDERLLTAFTAQAGIAIQNARLFTMTDQALAARVDELSVMQRIDRELNASLDLSRAMHITLDWSMRQSGAAAGMVVMLPGEGGIEVMDSQGYTGAAMNALERVAYLSLVRAALELRQPQIGTVDPQGAGDTLLPAARSQIAIPIQREQKPIGLIFLESTEEEQFTRETSLFLNRLGDHAAIAIANAQFYAAVQAANVAKSDFISFVSHELKTPMTSIKGYTDLLSAGAVGDINEAQTGFLATIRSNVDRMATLVSDLADISRIEAGRLRLDYSAVSVGDLVDDVVRSARRQLDEKNQALRVELTEPLPEVWGDRTRLVQVLTNLLNNAHKYTPEEGEIAIRARLAPRRGAAGIAGEQVEVSIVDNGIGIKPEDRQQIFTKFFRSDDQKAREAPGTGLGLNITKNLVEMQGGQIWFESEFRKGTAFHFTIPVAETA
jgi:signal transduction histidine kinase